MNSLAAVPNQIFVILEQRTTLSVRTTYQKIPVLWILIRIHQATMPLHHVPCFLLLEIEIYAY